MLAFVFPGQGSQVKGMGAKLFDLVPEFLDVEEQVDALLGYSLRQLCCDNPERLLNRTDYTQPCLYVVNALYYYHALAQGKQPDCVAGHSLGEYNALLAAGAFDFLTGLRLVQERGRLMSQAQGGAMAAIVGLEATEIKSVLQQGHYQHLSIANYNSPLQTVITGDSHEVNSIQPALKAAGAKMCVTLPVSAAFHSPFMASAATEFSDFLKQFSFQALTLPVVANSTGEFYPAGDATQVIRHYLSKQIVSSVQWLNSIYYCLDQGVTEFSEQGPGKVLTRLIEQTEKIYEPDLIMA